MNKYLWIFLSVILIVGSGCGTKEESSPTQAAPQPKVTEQQAPQDGNPTDVASNNSQDRKGETARADIDPVTSNTESVAGVEPEEEGAKGFARSQFDTITSGDNWTAAGGAIKGAAGSALEGTKNFFGSQGDIISRQWGSIWDGTKDVVGSQFDTITSGDNWTAAGIKDLFSSSSDQAPSDIAPVTSGVTTEGVSPVTSSTESAVEEDLDFDKVRLYHVYFMSLLKEIKENGEPVFVYTGDEALAQAIGMVKKEIALDPFKATLNFLSQNVSDIGDAEPGYFSKKLVLYALKFISKNISLEQFKNAYHSLKNNIKDKTTGKSVYLSVARSNTPSEKKTLLVYLALKLLDPQRLQSFHGLYAYLSLVPSQMGGEPILSQSEAFLIASVLFESDSFNADMAIALQNKIQENLAKEVTYSKLFGKAAIVQALKELNLYSASMNVF